MRATVTAVALTGCAAPPMPPVLPGELEPPCALAAAQAYLITDLTVPDTTALPIDLHLPPDRLLTSENDPYVEIEALTPDLQLATRRATSQRWVLWVVVIASCSDAQSDYARVALRRGVSVSSEGPPPVVSVSSDPYTWAVGTAQSGDLDAYYGLGPAPITVGIDVDADHVSTPWYPTYADAFHVTVSDSGASGIVSVATQTAVLTDDVSAALARTVTRAALQQPACPGSQCTNPWLAQLLMIFDPDGDRIVSGPDITANGNLENVFNVSPRFDLLVDHDGTATYWPNHDHIADANLWRFSFQAVRVEITEP